MTLIKNLTIIFLIIIIIIIPQLIYSQNSNLEFEHITIKEGLSQNTVFSIFQDDNGFMWFGTGTGGLIKYDGCCFKQFGQNYSDSKYTYINDISRILKDKSNIIWIGSWGGGVIKFNPETETYKAYLHDKSDRNSLNSNNTQTIFEDSKGRLWIGTADNGLDRFDREKNIFIHYKNNPRDTNSLINNRIWSISEDKSGCLWIGTSIGLEKFNSETNKFSHYFNDKNNQVRCVYVNKNDDLIWFGTTTGLNKFNHKTNTISKYRPYKKNKSNKYINEINVISEDKNDSNNLWIGTHFGGLCKFNIKDKTFLKFVHDYDNPYSINNNDIRDIYTDRSGILWIATRGGGINKLNQQPRKFKHFWLNPNNKNSLNDNRVRTFVEDDKGNIWIGTNGGGINIYNPSTKKFSYIKKNDNNKNSLSSNNIISIYKDKNNIFWIGTNGSGLNKFDKNKNKFTQYFHDDNNKNSIIDNFISDICKDKYGNIWIGTGKGLDKYTAKKNIFKHYQHIPNDNNSICNNLIYSLHIDKSGIIWIGTDDGLDKFNPQTETFKHFKNEPNDTNTLSNNDVLDIFEDNEGGLWIGTAKGLNKLNRIDETFDTFSNYEINNYVIVGILEDDDNNLWLSTIKGLSKFNPKTKKIRNYDGNDGLQSNEFTKGAHCKLKTGELLFGGINGFNSFFPKNIKNNTNIPSVVVTDFKIYNKSVKIANNSILKKRINKTKELILSYKHSSFSFSFAALEYTNPKKNQYAYKLEGFDADWNYVGSQKTAKYTNIEHGEYTFKVKASNNDGIWNNKASSIKIIIKPPFWKTKWAYFLEYLIILLAIYLFIFFKERTLKRDKKKLENKVKIRTIELEQKNKEILAQSEELEKLSIVAQETDNAILICGNKGEIEWVNEGFTRLYGYTLMEYFAEKGKSITLTSSNSNFFKIFKRCIEQKVSVVYTSRQITKHNREIWVQTTLTPILDNADNIIRFIAIDADITKIKLAENELENQRDQIEEQRDYINSQNIEITSSIEYAERIQAALLPPKENFYNIFPRSFILYKPRDIVSGDFYWLSEKDGKIFVAVADCTGHGVPGALLSMLGTSFLTQIVNENEQIHPNEILYKLKEYLSKSLHQTGKIGEVNEGLDISIIKIDKKNKYIEFAGAMNPLFITKKSDENNYSLTEIKGDRIIIGIYTFLDVPFANHKINIEKGDTLYMFTDGYCDQFGGDDNKKLKKVNFKKIILATQEFSMKRQKEVLINSLNEWKGKNDQIDDILVVGIRF